MLKKNNQNILEIKKNAGENCFIKYQTIDKNYSQTAQIL